MTQGGGDCVGSVLKGSAYTVWPIRKDMVVMSQWAHSHLNLESPEASPACPVAMAAQRAKQEKAEGRCPCLVWKTSQWSVATEMGVGRTGAHGWTEPIRLWESILHC
jgi:hypothetical protein